ncbi:hypothetical protein [Psychrobacter proteolyticus]|uniref:hypothetical protein n=1 Tax=Psychrobacter proteolyticus TaxID=147825 RepID=UPI001D12F159|nr:hypothetical protein [Psychrobacter proteolyticus]
MKISEQWLRQWVNPNKYSSEQLAEQLTMAGLEIDDRNIPSPCFSAVWLSVKSSALSSILMQINYALLK